MAVTTTTTWENQGAGETIPVEVVIITPPGLSSPSDRLLLGRRPKRGIGGAIALVGNPAAIPTPWSLAWGRLSASPPAYDLRVLQRHTQVQVAAWAERTGLDTVPRWTVSGLTYVQVAQRWTGSSGIAGYNNLPTAGHRLLAPLLTAGAPDLAVDADCPEPWGNGRIVWADGIPFWVSRSDDASHGDAAGTWTRRAVRRSHADWLEVDYNWANQPCAHLSERGNEIVPLTHLASGGMPARKLAIYRDDLPATVTLYPVSVALMGPAESTDTVRCRWHVTDQLLPWPGSPRTAPLSGWTAIGSHRSGWQIDADPTTLTVPTYSGAQNLCVLVEYRTTWSPQYEGDPGEYVWHYCHYLGDSSPNATVKASTLAPPLAWPWDVPRCAPAHDDATTRYVGSAGWVRPAHGLMDGKANPSEPTVTRSGTNIHTTWTGAVGEPPADGSYYNGGPDQIVMLLSCPGAGYQVGGAWKTDWWLPSETVGHPVTVQIDAWWEVISSLGGRMFRTRRWTFSV